MPIDKYLQENAAYIQEHLKNFLANYHLLSDEKRMNQSNEIFSHLRTFFQADHILADATLKRDASLENAVNTYRAKEEKIWEIYEHTINIHVDEPNDEYVAQLQRIQSEFQAFTTLEYERLLTRMVGQLSDEEKEGLMSKVKKDPEVMAQSL